MAKYSTGGSGGDAGGTCELCGADEDLRTATVAGATLEVCAECAHHDDAATETDDGDRSDSDRNRRAARNTARLDDVRTGDSTHWEEEGTDYEDDRLPYLVSDYGVTVTEARQDAGLQVAEVAAELDVEEGDLLAVEQGRANQANVGGGLIDALEERLDVQLAEER